MSRPPRATSPVPSRPLLSRARGWLRRLRQVPPAPKVTPSRDEWLSHLLIDRPAGRFEILPPVLAHKASEPWVDLSGLLTPAQLEARMRQDDHPLPATLDREGYHGDRHLDYWLSGLKDYLSVEEVLKRLGRELVAGDAVFELGCASGRVARHFACQRPELELWASDLNARHVEWVRRFLPGRIRVFQNTSLPSLPLEDRSLQVVCAFSVFTHIDLLESAWLAEIRRVLRPGGIAYLTIHSDHTWATMSPSRQLFHDVMAMKEVISGLPVTTAMFESPMPGERVVLAWPTANVYNCNVFVSHDYVRAVWGRFFEVVEILPEAHDYQDVVVLRRP